MREIKFRAWDKVSKSMHYNVGVTMAKSSDVFVGDGKSGGAVNISIHNKKVVIMQFTGLKDKNGKEIYEGDIVDKGYCQKRADVVFVGGMFFTKPVRLTIEEFMKTDDYGGYEEMITFLCPNRAKEIKVIGNVYKNPELKTIECSRCKGTMRIPDYEEPEASVDGKMPCPDCEGEGEIEVD